MRIRALRWFCTDPEPEGVKHCMIGWWLVRDGEAIGCAPKEKEKSSWKGEGKGGRVGGWIDTRRKYIPVSMYHRCQQSGLQVKNKGVSVKR